MNETLQPKIDVSLSCRVRVEDLKVRFNWKKLRWQGSVRLRADGPLGYKAGSDTLFIGDEVHYNLNYKLT